MLFTEERPIWCELPEHEERSQKTLLSTAAVRAPLAARLIKGQLASLVPKQHNHIKGEMALNNTVEVPEHQVLFPLASDTSITPQAGLMERDKLKLGSTAPVSS